MTVYLIGAGPGDPGLLTVRGQAILRTADVIIHDRLVAPEMLMLARHDALVINVGKNPDGRRTTQEAIQRLLIEHGQMGRSVARLKGGDPFVFGRGGEELMACKAAGVPVEVIPGVTSALAASAYAGIPVTHRHVSTSFTVTTGHEEPGKPETSVNYEALAGLETLVFMMGVRRLPDIVETLMHYGRDPETPVVCIEWVSYPTQRIISGTLGTIVQRAEEQNLSNPSIIIMGEVAGLMGELAWQPASSLTGRRVYIPAESDEFLAQLLIAKGAWMVRVSDRFRPVRIDELPPDVILITQPEQVKMLEVVLKDTIIVCVGQVSAEALHSAGYTPAITLPESSTANAIAAAMENAIAETV